MTSLCPPTIESDGPLIAQPNRTITASHSPGVSSTDVHPPHHHGRRTWLATTAASPIYPRADLWRTAPSLPKPALGTRIVAVQQVSLLGRDTVFPVTDIDEVLFNALVDSDRIRANDQNQWRYKVLMAVADAGDAGATDNELAELLQAPGGQNNIRPRRGELVDYGFVVDSGLKRPTSSGKLATIWRLSEQDHLTLTPTFTESDCRFAQELISNNGQTFSQPIRKAADDLRAQLALLGRRARRAAADLGTPVELDIEGGAAIKLTAWRAEAERLGFSIDVALDGQGLHLSASVGSADSGNAARDARARRFRAELASLPSHLTSTLDRLVAQGYVLTTTTSAGTTDFDSTHDWLTDLVTVPSTCGAITHTLRPEALAQAGPAIADQLTELIITVLPLESAAETAMQDPVQALVNGLLWGEDRARDLISLTRRARQLLFAGPPGTGKTLAARILAGALANDSRIKLVQFHPTYAYEDFVEGIRPVLDQEPGPVETTNFAERVPSGSGIRYQIRPGVLKQIGRDARDAPEDARHFLIIDEINRANLPRVLGELLFALEYRGPANEVNLAYSAEPFYLPENLWIIGTMNTADRSVALLDAAMRRRFKEVRFDVDYTVIRRWHERHTSAELGTEAAARLERLNAHVIELLDEDRVIGHSFLIRHDLSEVGFSVVWNEDLEPVLRDHLLGRTDDLPALREAFLGHL